MQKNCARHLRFDQDSLFQIKYVNLRPQEMQYTRQLSNEKDFRNVIYSYSPAIGL